jgi:hypothetical protein
MLADKDGFSRRGKSKEFISTSDSQSLIAAFVRLWILIYSCAGARERSSLSGTLLMREEGLGGLTNRLAQSIHLSVSAPCRSGALSGLLLDHGQLGSNPPERVTRYGSAWVGSYPSGRWKRSFA